MSMTWGQIRLQCQKWGGDAADLDQLDQFIQDRYQRILDAHPWKPLEKQGTLAVTAGSAGTRSVYVLPADCKILLQIANPANYPLRPYTQQELNTLYPGRNDTGSPFIYSMAEDDSSTPPKHQVEIYPIPTGSVSLPIRYIQIPATFDPTAMTQSPLPWIPTHLIINGVRADICSMLKDYAGMGSFENQFAAGINEMLRVELHAAPNSKIHELLRYQGAAQMSPPPSMRGGGGNQQG